MIRVIGFLFVLSFIACGGSNSGGLNNQPCQFKAGTADNRIINGEDCSQGSPIVQISISPDDDFVDFCSGTLITPSVVLTAAHCLINEPQSITVRSGNDIIQAKRIIIHPEYTVDDNALLTFNDVGLIVLSKQFNQSTIPLLISRDVESGQDVRIYGYGLDENGKSNQLNTGKMNITSTTATHLNANFDGTGSNTCAGDSGGAVIQTINPNDSTDRYGLVGVIASGEKELCLAGDISHFTKINQPSIINFILDNVPSAGLI